MPTAKLITKNIDQQLRKNHRSSVSSGTSLMKMKPVVKLFTPDAAGTWLLVSLDEHNIAYGLCDLGLGCPEVGSVSLEEIKSVRGNWGLPVERDRGFIPQKTLDEYAQIAKKTGGMSAIF